MKLFISWSGDISQQIAQQLRDWVPLILPAVKPFITTTDIDKGARWQGDISRELDQSNFGIVCLTSENLSSQWLAFEAGALSKHLSGRVATILCGLEHRDVPAPLNMFQGTRFNMADMRQLVLDIDEAVAVENCRGDAQLEKVFPVMWKELEAAVDLILKAATSGTTGPTPATVDAAVTTQEMMALLRQQNAILSSPERFLGPLMERLDRLSVAVRRADFRTGLFPWPPTRRPPRPQDTILGAALSEKEEEEEEDEVSSGAEEKKPSSE